MVKNVKGLVLVFLCFTVFPNMGYSQSTYKVKETKGFDIKVSGTSTLHDWEMETLKSTGEAKFMFEAGSEKNLVSVSSLSFALLVTNLKSDSDGLNDNAYEALKTEENKYIKYKLTSSTITPEKDGYLIKSNGKLTVAGVTKDIKMDVHAIVNDDGTVSTKGSYKLKMTDYKIEPPSFLLGAMTTGDDITVDFNVVYKK